MEALNPGIVSLKWNSDNINPFISKAMITVTEVDELVKKMKENVRRMTDTMDKWTKPLFDRKNKALPAEDVENTHQALVAPRLEDIALCSLGVGQSLRHLTGDRLDWGYAQWARPLVNILIHGVMGVADYQCRQFLRDRYWRVNPVFPPGIEINLDDVAQVGYLNEFAQQIDLDETLLWIDRSWR